MEPLLSNIQDGSNNYKSTASYSPILTESDHHIRPPTGADGDEHKEGSANKLRCYKRRWYVLALFSITVASQAALIATWIPIADTAKEVLNWTDADIALLLLWGVVVSTVTNIPFSGLMDKLGLRKLFLLSQLSMLLGVGVACLPVDVQYFKYTANASQVLIGLSGPILASGPPVVSATWFPANQRTTSTAISASAAQFGIAGIFLLGPAIVKELDSKNATVLVPAHNGTSVNTSDMPFTFTHQENTSSSVKAKHIKQIYKLLRIHLVFIAIQFLLALLYFPSKPPTAPSISAETKKEMFWEGAKHLIRRRQFWIPSLACSGLGIYSGWITQIDTMFKHTVEVGQQTVGWIAFYTNIAAVIGMLVAGGCVDFLGGRMKLVLLMITTLATVSFVWFALLCYGAIPFSMVSLYVSCIAYGLFINAAIPIYYEVNVAGNYPVAEGITTGAVNCMYNLTVLMVLLVMMIPNIGVNWINWAVLGATALTIPLLAIYKEDNKRLLLDTHKEAS